MGDSSHLEKMGRELKCPICLSLLNSAVSLTCNHVFCNACIMISMKSGSDCPVCKVPYRRREVRAAPHMDNLVSIYKSMEVASGINIFVTQNAPSTKSSDEEKHGESDSNCSGQLIGGICQDMENQQTSKRKGLKRTNKSNLESPGPNIVKPTFPTKKRVQVPRYPPESSITPAKFDGLVGKAKDEFKNSSAVSKENPVQNENGQLALSPFFWLREEEDVENLSQLADRDQLMDITPPNVPSFSDMKDSDDENPSRGEVHGKSNIVDLFDSEMFEWTQRACSPELLSSPVKTQVLDNNENDEIQERKLEAASQGVTNEKPFTRSAKCLNTRQETGTSNDEPNISSPRAKKTNNQNRKSNKGLRKAKEIVRQKRAKINGDQASGVNADLHKESENFEKTRKLSYGSVLKVTDENGGTLNFEKTRKRSKKVGSGIYASDQTPWNVPSASLNAESSDQAEQNMVNDSPALLCEKQGADEYPNLKKSKESSKIHTRHQKDCTLRSKKRKLDSAESSILEKDSTIQNQKSVHMYPQKSFLPACMADDNVTIDLKENPSEQDREVKSALTSKYNRELKCTKKMKVSFSEISRDGLVDDCQDGHTNVSVKEIKSTGKVQDSPAVKKFPSMNGVALRKCETVANKIQCAFCLSSEDSEASGEMVHYYNSRPVSADYNGGSKIIHSHKNCTEWAPNIYFEDDTAINLEAELSRSRRIKCCLCGLKGAALGCYEKSCRKSFHVPCAKLIPQCRWDTDNFVILCPLHESSKLPIENSGSKERTKNCTSKVHLSTQCNQVSIKHDISTHQDWNLCGSSEKLILCCSALSIEEREIVFEFEKLSGVTVLKQWESSVTHVIASTNENGACRRTLKVLMGILEGKWILNIEWVKASMEAMKRVYEEQYEITIDVYGIRDGPRHGRQRLLNKQPKLFYGLKFYLMGDFIPSYKGYLQDLVTAAGGTILHRRPISGDQGALLSSSSKSSTFIIYSLELHDKCDPSKKTMILSRRQSDAETLASSAGAKAVSNSWVLNSIAACKLQSF